MLTMSLPVRTSSCPATRYSKPANQQSGQGLHGAVLVRAIIVANSLNYLVLSKKALIQRNIGIYDFQLRLHTYTSICIYAKMIPEVQLSQRCYKQALIVLASKYKLNLKSWGWQDKFLYLVYKLMLHSFGSHLPQASLNTWKLVS